MIPLNRHNRKNTDRNSGKQYEDFVDRMNAQHPTPDMRGVSISEARNQFLREATQREQANVAASMNPENPSGFMSTSNYNPFGR